MPVHTCPSVRGNDNCQPNGVDEFNPSGCYHLQKFYYNPLHYDGYRRMNMPDCLCDGEHPTTPTYAALSAQLALLDAEIEADDARIIAKKLKVEPKYKPKKEVSGTLIEIHNFMM